MRCVLGFWVQGVGFRVQVLRGVVACVVYNFDCVDPPLDPKHPTTCYRYLDPFTYSRGAVA